MQYHIMTQPVRVALDASWPVPPAPFNQVPTASGTKMKVSTQLLHGAGIPGGRLGLCLV